MRCRGVKELACGHDLFSRNDRIQSAICLLPASYCHTGRQPPQNRCWLTNQVRHNQSEQRGRGPPFTMNTCVCGLTMTTASPPKGFLFPQCHRRNGNDYEIEREEKSREMKQEMLPQKGTCLFLVNLHKQKHKGPQDHKCSGKYDAGEIHQLLLWAFQAFTA